MAGYSQMLGALASRSAAPVGAPPAAMGVGAGPPPQMPDLPPSPTNVGAMPTGDPGSTAKGAADDSILSLRTASGFFPSLKPQIDQMIDQLKAAAQAQAPASPLGVSTPLGSPPPDVPPTDLSGVPGA